MQPVAMSCHSEHRSQGSLLASLLLMQLASTTAACHLQKKKCHFSELRFVLATKT